MSGWQPIKSSGSAITTSAWRRHEPSREAIAPDSDRSIPRRNAPGNSRACSSCQEENARGAAGCQGKAQAAEVVSKDQQMSLAIENRTLRTLVYAIPILHRLWLWWQVGSWPPREALLISLDPLSEEDIRRTRALFEGEKLRVTPVRAGAKSRMGR